MAITNRTATVSEGAAVLSVTPAIPTGVGYNGGDDHVDYTSRPENVSQNGQGNLALTIRRENSSYTSGRINSGGRRQFAPPVRIESRVKAPTEDGVVPSFWTLGSSYGPWGDGPIAWPDCGEIDALEITNHNPNRALYHLHGPDASNALDQVANRDVLVGSGYTDGADLDTAYHVYGVDLYPDRAEFRFDGVIGWTVTRADYEAAGGRWTGVFDQAQYVVLNVASLYSWVRDANFTGSRSMLVDWVRVSAL